jgi:ATP-dependent Lon protease
VLPIGGVREKVLAGYRAKLTTVILPEKNKKDLPEIPARVRSSLDMRWVRHMDEVLEIALQPAPPRPARPRRAPRKSTKAAAAPPGRS